MKYHCITFVFKFMYFKLYKVALCFHELRKYISRTCHINELFHLVLTSAIHFYVLYYTLPTSMSDIIQIYFTDEKIELEGETICLWQQNEAEPQSCPVSKNMPWITPLWILLWESWDHVDWFQENRREKRECIVEKIVSALLWDTYT